MLIYIHIHRHLINIAIGITLYITIAIWNISYIDFILYQFLSIIPNLLSFWRQVLFLYKYFRHDIS